MRNGRVVSFSDAYLEKGKFFNFLALGDAPATYFVLSLSLATSHWLSAFHAPPDI